MGLSRRRTTGTNSSNGDPYTTISSRDTRKRTSKSNSSPVALLTILLVAILGGFFIFTTFHSSNQDADTDANVDGQQKQQQIRRVDNVPVTTKEESSISEQQDPLPNEDKKNLIHNEKVGPKTLQHDEEADRHMQIRSYIPQERREDQQTVCINSFDSLPDAWKPPMDVNKDRPWTEAEQALANEAMEKGLEELLDIYSDMTEEEIVHLGYDAVTSMIEQTYARQHMKSYRKKALDRSIKNLLILGHKYVTKDSPYQGCNNQFLRLRYLGFSHYLHLALPMHAELTGFRKLMIRRVRQMFVDCESLNNMLELGDLPHLFDNPDATPSAAQQLMWLSNTNALVDVMAIPEMESSIPQEAYDFVANVWNHFRQDDKFINARDNPKGFQQRRTRAQAFVVTHVPYLSSGYGRHINIASETPKPYQWVRENLFYAIQDGDMLNLVSEMLDLIRQFGCTEENDIQLRYGVRFLLKLYTKAGHSWVNHREESEVGRHLMPHSLIHKPWTAIRGIIGCLHEPIEQGSYGYAFQQALLKAAK